MLRSLAPGAQVILGQEVGLSAATICAERSIEIGEGMIVGSDAIVMDNDLHMPEGAQGWAYDCQATARPVKKLGGVFSSEPVPLF